MLAIGIYVFHAWFNIPGFLVLLVIPTALATITLGSRATTMVAIGETLFLAFFSRYLIASKVELTITIIAIWAAVGIMYAAYQPVLQLAQWSWEHFERARSLLEEARDRQAELKDALDALAQANRQLSLANQKLAAMRLLAERAEKTKAAFVANVSHEFRTPLNMIIGLVDLAMETPEVYGDGLSHELLQDLEIVHRNCQHLSGMINDVLDLSQIEANRLALHKDYIDFQDMIRRALSVVQPLLTKKHLALRVETQQDLPKIYCDRTRMRQVILNLVSNAARFTEKGGITVKAKSEGPYVIASVADTGPGISDEDAERIFEPFQQAGLRQPREGSGPGLSISKEFVELHGGRMWLGRALGHGSTFFFRLPIHPDKGPSAPPERWITDGWVKRTTRADTPKARIEERVILCDASGTLYPIFSRYADHVEFVDARNLTEASRELQRSAAQAVLINAPSPNELWSLVARASEKMQDMPIIGFSIPPKTAHALEAGATAYLLKPITQAALREPLGAVGKPIKSVLVVDDEADACRLLARMLRAYNDGLRIKTAPSGEQALEEMRNGPPDLVLLDIVMPDMDGFEVLAAKAEEEAIRHIPVILISAQDPQDRPLSSSLVVGTRGGGLSISQCLRCSRELSALLLQPD